MTSSSGNHRRGMPRVAQMMGAADSMLSSYRESLRFSLSTAGTSSSTPTQTLSPPRGAIPTTIFEGTTTLPLAGAGDTNATAKSDKGSDATTVMAGSDPSIVSATATDLGASPTADLDELLDRHSDKILNKLLSKLSPQQRELLSDLN